MKIGLNATCFNDRPSGARQRFYGLYGEVIRRCRDIEFVVYEPSDFSIAHEFGNLPNVTVRRTPIPSSGRIRRLLHGMGYWRRTLTEDRLDLFEAFNLPLVRAPGCPTVLTIHDLRPVRTDVPVVARAAYAWVLRRAFDQAARVIAVSDAVKAEIGKFQVGTGVTTIHNGVDVARFTDLDAAALDAFRRKFALPDAFLLSVGHLEKRKNYGCLIEAVACLEQTGLQRPLVIVGNDGGEAGHIERRIEAAGCAGQIRILRNATDADLQILYRLCRFVVFPSTYEGFGIPILEAMAAGRAILLSDIPVFRVITEDHGAYFSADDSGALAAAIERLWTSDEERQRLVAYGHKRVHAFSFPVLARQIEQLYRSLLPGFVEPGSVPKIRARRARATAIE